MQELYSSGLHKNQKVVTVFIGAKDIPSDRQCGDALMMDPEIQAPVLVIPFGGLTFEGAEDDDVVAELMISRDTPDFMETDFSYRCTRVRDLLLIKVLVPRSFGKLSEPVQSDKDVADELSRN